MESTRRQLQQSSAAGLLVVVSDADACSGTPAEGGATGQAGVDRRKALCDIRRSEDRRCIRRLTTFCTQRRARVIGLVLHSVQDAVRRPGGTMNCLDHGADGLRGNMEQFVSIFTSRDLLCTACAASSYLWCVRGQQRQQWCRCFPADAVQMMARRGKRA